MTEERKKDIFERIGDSAEESIERGLKRLEKPLKKKGPRSGLGKPFKKKVKLSRAIQGLLQ